MQLSHSEMKTFVTCKRKWWLSHYRAYGVAPDREAPVGSRIQGTRIHLAMEANYGYGLDALAVLDWQYKRAIAAHPEAERELRKEQALSVAMVEGYFDWAAEEGYDVGIEVIAAEREASVSIKLQQESDFTFELVSKLDLLIRRESDGALLFRDWKTRASLQNDGLIRDTQMRTYALIQALTAVHTGDRVDGGQYMMLRRVGRTARSKPPYYGQAEVRYNRHDFNSTYQRVQTVAGEIAVARARLDAGEDHHAVAYPSPGDHCDYMCIFKDICPLFDDGSRADDALVAEYDVIDPYARYSDDAIIQVRKELSDTVS